jgi:hypothetical protein
MKYVFPGSNVFPFRASMRSSGLNVLYIESTIFSKPLNTERIMIRAALPTKTPSMEMPEIKLIALTDFFENRYLLAI